MGKKEHQYKRPPKQIGAITVTDEKLDKNASNRIGKQDPKYIVIHEVSLGTGKSPKRFNMEHYSNMIKEYGRTGRTIGYHYLVGDKEVYQFLEDDVATEHTGTEFGNHNSIGIERLICEGVNYEYATHNQAKLIATLMLKHNIPIENVITHKHMQEQEGKENPKQCPGRMLAGFRGGVQDFKHEIERCFIYGWFFEDLLDEETKKKIPEMQSVFKRKFEERNKRIKEQRGKTVKPNNLLEEFYK